jgi:hypothetical protein
MPYNANESYVLADWSFGWDLSTSPLDLDKRALTDCKNFNLTTKRGLEKRGGMTALYPTAAGGGAQVQDLFEYKAPNGTTYVLAAVSTKIQSYYSAAWNDLVINLTAGKRYSFAGHQGFCYGVNGTNANFKLYNTTAYGVGIAPPAAAPTVTDGGPGALTGKYQYVYCYKRSTPNSFTGNPSAANTALDLTTEKFNVAYTLSADTQVDKIVIYRTLDLNLEGTDPLAFFKVTEVANATSSYDDETADADLGTSLVLDNTVPPKSKFVILHKDRIFYLNCPDETDGATLGRWSKVGEGDAAPTANYQYFDRKDGEDITGAASVGDYLLVFKRNKIFVVEGDFANFYTISHGIGCIASWGIIPFEDKVVFLSEEGWRAFDGVNLYDLSESIRPLCGQGYVTIGQNANYSAVYYPVKDQFLYLCNHSSLTKRVFVGHFLVPLLYINKGIPEQLSQNIVGWTYHEYPNHTLTCLGTYTDTLGITRVIAGSSNGYVYLLDSGGGDVTYDIPYSMLTGWQPLGKSPGVSKTVRLGFISLAVDLECTLTFTIEKDYESPFYTTEIELVGTDTAYCGYMYCGSSYLGMGVGFTERVAIPGSPGQLYRFGLSGSDKTTLTLQAMTFMFRSEGVK